MNKPVVVVQEEYKSHIKRHFVIKDKSHLLFIFLPIFIYILLYCVTYFALSVERTWPDLHFTTDYILYNWVCDE